MAARNALACGLLAALTVAALQFTCLLAQLGELTSGAGIELRETSRQAQATLVQAQAVLSSARGTAETVRRSAVHQMGHYEAVGRRAASVMGRVELLLARTDARSERITRVIETSAARADASFDQSNALMHSLQKDLHEFSMQGSQLTKATTELIDSLNQGLADHRLDQITASLSESTANTAQATANLAEATGYVRDILSPKRKSFWLRIVEWLIPRPSVTVP